MKILQIIPATSWLAIYGPENENKDSSSPVACWALVEDDEGSQFVIGMVDGGGVSLLMVEEAESPKEIFKGYRPQRIT